MSDQLTIETTQAKAGPVECFGIHFDSEDARRSYFLEKLRAKLKDPAFRKIEGFPTGSDEDILRLSDPPYYTACPNPFAKDFISHYGQPYGTELAPKYHREPFAADVSEGKNDAVYSAHSYHTKVPFKAVMHYVLHYTRPGHVIFDGFSGSGMAGIAAQMCADADTIKGLGYTVRNAIVTDAAGADVSEVGVRRAVLNDLSPFASSMSYLYNSLDQSAFRQNGRVRQVIDELRRRWGWAYSTEHSRGQRETADFYVWSDFFTCPNCSSEGTLFDLAVDLKTSELLEIFKCPACGKELSKGDLERSWTTEIDPLRGDLIKSAKCGLVQVVCGQRRYRPTSYDFDILKKLPAPQSWAPDVEFPHGRQTRKVRNGSGIARVQQMFTKRALAIIADAWNLAEQLDSISDRSAMRFLISSALVLVSRRERFRDGAGKGSQSGTLYVPSLQVEKNVIAILERKADGFRQLPIKVDKKNCLVSVGSHSNLTIPDSSVDYIFTDPPFGEPLQYGELNFFHEAWMRVTTNLANDCVINYVHEKDLSFYSQRMKRNFVEAYRILKPGGWITVEFHNTQNSVWMAIQEALEAAGFVVADVRVLDKKEGSFNQVTRAGAVQKDLVISSYKANGGFEERFELEKGTEEGVWDFVKTHLRQLPVFVSQKGKGEPIAERQSFMLFDRMVAFHVQRGLLVPLSAAEFYEGLSERFEYRDGMYFLSDQIDEYDKKKQTVSELRQLELIVRDENSAVQWLRQQLTDKPQRFSELQPQFMRETGGWSKEEERLELSEILRLNFFRYDGEGEVPVQVRNYLSKNFHDVRGLEKSAPALQQRAKDRWYVPDPNKAIDLEKIRERELLRTFDEYRASSVKKIKIPRLEALRAGFKRAWDQRDYTTIVDVAAKIPESILQEDSKLLMFYDLAATRLGVA